MGLTIGDYDGRRTRRRVRHVDLRLDDRVPAVRVRARQHRQPVVPQRGQSTLRRRDLGGPRPKRRLGVGRGVLRRGKYRSARPRDDERRRLPVGHLDDAIRARAEAPVAQPGRRHRPPDRLDTLGRRSSSVAPPTFSGRAIPPLISASVASAGGSRSCASSGRPPAALRCCTTSQPIESSPSRSRAVEEPRYGWSVAIR